MSHNELNVRWPWPDGEDVDLTALPDGIPTPVGLLIDFVLDDGTEWVVSFGHYPNGKYPCNNGDWALVTRHEDGNAEYWTLETGVDPAGSPRDVACLIEQVGPEKGNGPTTQEARGKIHFPFRLAMWR